MTLTPEQFNKLVTKDEFNELKRDVKKIDNKVDRILTSVDGLAKSVNDFKAEISSNQGAHDRMLEKVNSHEVRIKKLELKNI